MAQSFSDTSPAQQTARAQMVADLRAHGIRDNCVLEAMARVPRHDFLPEHLARYAYNNEPVPIGQGQTISQPYMVAIMTESLGLTGAERVLEIGTGSGYQTAILAELAAEIYTVERIPELLEQAKQRLEKNGYRNIHLLLGDGTKGWPKAAPFDAILVTAAAPNVLESYRHQLAEGGRLAIPVGARHSQTLMVYTKQRDNLLGRAVCSCIFVPLLGEYGWREES